MQNTSGVRIDEKVWFKRVRVLFEHPARFWPTRDMTMAAQINAMVRAIVYATLVLYAYNRSDRILFLGLALVALVTLGYNGTNFASSLRNIAPKRCRKPAEGNPFMNTLVHEYGTEDQLPPCNFEDVSQECKKHFNKGLFRNVEDVFEKENSQRQFIPMPNGGVPPDSREFANFLYGNMRSCKTFATDCVMNP
jgi:hypothetical protein